jgi:hypothetical protein
MSNSDVTLLVTTGLDPVVYADLQRQKPSGRTSLFAAWIAESSPAMTKETNKRKEAERRQTQYSMTCTQAAHRARHG